MIKKEFTFNLRQKVEILPIQVTGRVTALYVCEEGIQYRVRYFDNCECKSTYFYIDELKDAS